MEITTSTLTMAKIALACFKRVTQDAFHEPFQPRNKNGSCSLSKNFAFGSKYEPSTGVTVRETTREASKEVM